MLNILHAHNNLTDPTWSVIILLVCGLVFTGYIIAYIMIMAFKEMQNVQVTEQGQEGFCREQEAESGKRNSEEGKKRR